MGGAVHQGARPHGGHLAILGAVAGASALVLLASTGCVASPKPVAHIVRPGAGTDGDSELHTESGKPYTFGMMVICLDRPGRAVIDSVEPENGYGGLRIDAFVAVPNPHQTGGDAFGAADASIAQLSQPNSEPDHLTYTPPGNVVDHPCQPPSAILDPSTDSYVLYVQYSKPTDVTAGETGLVIHYTSDGQHLTMSAPVFNVLCGSQDTESQACGH